jgi:hypothetical protein
VLVPAGPLADDAVTVTALLQKLIDELDLRGFSPNTKDIHPLFARNRTGPTNKSARRSQE